MLTRIADPSPFLGRQLPGRMRLGAGQSNTKLALLSRLGAASRATNTQGFVLLGFHDSIMQYSPARSWSLLTTAPTKESGILVGR
jgi:hypothetical protein